MIVATLDETHPDHAEQASKFACIFGDEIDPEHFELFDFDIDEINESSPSSARATSRPVHVEAAVAELGLAAARWCPATVKGISVGVDVHAGVESLRGGQ